jgi:intein/homing endonuclease
MNKNIAYLLGAFCDGCLSTQYQIKFKQKNREWLEKVIIPIFNEEFGLSLGNKNVFIQEDVAKRYYLAFKNKNVWTELRKLLPEDKDAPSNIKNANLETQIHYIRGYWDADGGCPRVPQEGKKVYIKFTQKNKKSLEFIHGVLNNIGIKTGKVRLSEPEIWRFSINSKYAMLKFIKKIGSWHPEKRLRFEKMQTLICTSS